MYFYSSIINAVHEPKNKYFNIPEINVQQIWAGYFDRYINTNIGKVLIIFPGIQNFSAGPDFKDAIIKLSNQKIVKGSIEIHLKGSDWEKHSHHTNHLYKNIILHVTLEPNNINPQTFIEGYLNPKDLFFKNILPCNPLKINIEQLENQLYELAEIRFSIKVHELKQEHFLKQKLLSFLHIDKQKDDIQSLIYFLDELIKQKKSNHQIILNLQHKINSIHWQGGRNPGKSQLIKIPIVIYTLQLLKIINSRENYTFKNYKSEIKSLNIFNLKLAVDEFKKEIYGNIVIPFIASKLNKNLFHLWKNLPATEYGLIKKRLSIWGIQIKLNFALSQGILFLEK